MRTKHTTTLCKRLGAWALTLALVVGLLPQTAFAAGTDTGKAIQIGASGISGFDTDKGGTGYDYIYFGSWTAQDTYTTSGPIKWRVLDNQTNTEKTGLFLLSDGLLGTGDNGGVYFQQSYHDSNSGTYHKGSEPSGGDHTNCQIANAWQGSDAQAWCKDFYSGNLTTQEQGAVLATTKSDKAFISSTSIYDVIYDVPFAASENILNGDKVFFLSAEEAENQDYGFGSDDDRKANYNGSADTWGLRSPIANTTLYAGIVYYDGIVYYNRVTNDWPARPAFNLNLNSVLFTSAAVGGKADSTVDGNLTEVATYNGNEWKLTLLDGGRNFSVTETAATGKPGDTITLNYTGATVYNAVSAPNEYISVIIADSSGSVLYYDRVAQPGEATGTATITIPSGLTAGNYTLKVFSEQYNGDKMTDYASAFQNVDLHVHSWSAAWSSDDTHHWHNCTAAGCPITDNSGKDGYGTHTFGGWTTNNNGTHTRDCTCGKQEASNCTYDGEGKCTACGYVKPTYAISASPGTLDFGSETEGYADAPAAKIVTITNIGNQSVTVNLPASATYTITAGTEFESGTATLASGCTATFTVQPNTGLDVGSHDDTLNISGSGGTSASVKLSFTVNAVYTLTVDLNGGSGSTTGGTYPAGEVVNIDAGSRSNYRFTGWTSSNGGTFADASSASTTFTMPAANTTITANWQYNGGGGGVVVIYSA